MNNMIAPRRRLAIAFQRDQNWKYFLNYERLTEKIVKCEQRISFLQNCKKADIIPKFHNSEFQITDALKMIQYINFRKNYSRKKL